MRGVGRLLAVAGLVVTGLTGSAGAATVSVDREFIASELLVTAEPGEANQVTIGRSDNRRRVVVADSAAVVLDAGKGCSGGSEPGVAVSCRVPEFDLDFGSGRPLALGPLLLNVHAKLGDQDDVLDSTALPLTAGKGLQQTDLITEIAAGDGDDGVTTGATDDTVVPGPGYDTVGAGSGFDMFFADREVDGADLFDGGPDADMAAYSRRREGVALSSDDLPNDGAPGEGDQVLSVASMVGGAGSDSLLGSAGGNFQIGGLGDDLLVGFGGRDFQLGDDSRVAEELAIGFRRARDTDGDDVLDAGAGEDFVLGGGGKDRLEMGSGADLVDAAHRSLLEFPRSRHLERAKDLVDCGSGNDEGEAERIDRLTGCERVARLSGRDRGSSRSTSSMPARRSVDRVLDRLAHPLGEQRVGVLAARLLRRRSQRAGE